MAGGALRQVVVIVVRHAGVVVDDEPLRVEPQPVTNRRSLVEVRDSQSRGESVIVARQCRGLLRANPPDEIVLGLIAIGVFNSQPRLSDAAHSCGDSDSVPSYERRT